MKVVMRMMKMRRRRVNEIRYVNHTPTKCKSTFGSSDAV